MFEHVRAGQRWQPKEFELNAVLDAGAAHAASQGVGPPGQPQGGANLRPVVIRVVNKTGADISTRYRAFSLSIAEWQLTTAKNLADSAFALVPYRADLPVAVVQQPIVSNAVGFAVVSGPTLVECSSGGDSNALTGTPGAGGLLTTGTGPVVITQPRPSGGGVVLAVLGGGSAPAAETDLVYAFLGIPAAVNDSTSGYTFRHGRRLCYRVATVQTPDGELRSFVWNTHFWVYNSSFRPIPEGTMLPVIKINGFWFATQAGVQTDPPTPDPNPAIIPLDRLLDGDPLNERILI